MYKTELELKLQMGDLNITNHVLELRWKAYEEKRKEKEAIRLELEAKLEK